jgi:hypothetical protein
MSRLFQKVVESASSRLISRHETSQLKTKYSFKLSAFFLAPASNVASFGYTELMSATKSPALYALPFFQPGHGFQQGSVRFPVRAFVLPIRSGVQLARFLRDNDVQATRFVRVKAAKPSGPLHQSVNRADVRKHQIRADIHAHFPDLGQNGDAFACAFFCPKPQAILPLLPFCRLR